LKIIYNKNIEKRDIEFLKKVVHGQIENLEGPVSLCVFMDGTGK
jgi:hypothetical protein